MADVGFGRIQRPAVVPNVLGAVEHPECQTGQEISGRQQPGDWTQSKPGAVLQEVADVFQLRNVVFSISAVFHQEWKHVVVFFAGVGRVEAEQLLEDDAPRGGFFWGVFDVWEWLAVAIIVGNVGEVLATCPVYLIGKTGMVGV